MTPLDPNHLPDDYGSLIESAGLTIEARWDQNDWQGETFMVVRPKDDLSGKVGLLNYGWGSCSGCDPFQGAVDFRGDNEASAKNLEELRAGLINAITWFPSPAELLAAIESPDYRRQFYISDWMLDEFVTAVRARFGGAP